MMQGVLCPDRVRLLLKKGSKCYRQRRTGEKKREQQIPGLTDEEKPIRLGPKRVSKIRKLFNLTENDDVRKFVVRRKITTKNGVEYSKAPKITTKNGVEYSK